MAQPDSQSSPPHRLITVTGEDRPGLIAAVARTLADSGADIEDVSMTRLMGNFAMMLVARGGDERQLRDGLEETGRAYGLHVHLEPSVSPQPQLRANAFVSAAGPNRIGILAGVAAALARHGANITELASRLLERTEAPVYLIRLEAVAPEDFAPLERDLRSVGEQLGVEVRLERIQPGDM